MTLAASTGTPPVARSATGTLTVVGPPGSATDADGDGMVDLADRCPSTPRGRFDADADGCVGPYARIAASTSGTWSVGRKGVRIGTMRLKGLPRGARVRLRGRVRQTLTARRTTLDLARLTNRLLPRGKGFTATVTRPGFVGQELALRVKPYGNTTREFKRVARNPFKRTRRCIPVGAAAPARTCDTTPPAGP